MLRVGSLEKSRSEQTKWEDEVILVNFQDKNILGRKHQVGHRSCGRYVPACIVCLRKEKEAYVRRTESIYKRRMTVTEVRKAVEANREAHE